MICTQKLYTIYMNHFTEAVRHIVRNISLGQTLSYGKVASLAGNPRAARVVGTIMRNNYDETVPCHRVVATNGIVGQYNRGGPQEKIRLLKSEGVKFTKTGKIDMSVYE